MLITGFSIVYLFTIVSLKTKKENKFLYMLLFISLVILMGGVTSNPDYLNYKYIYDFNIPGLEIGFTSFMKLIQMSGLSYDMFRLINTFVGICLIHISLNKLNINKSYFFVLYVPYLFIFDSIQIRNFLMMSIILYALSNLITAENKKRLNSNIIFLLFVLLAFSLQKLGIVYLFFPIFLLLLKKNRYLIVFSFLIFAFAILLITPDVYQPIFKMLMTSLFNDSGLTTYFTRKVDSGFIIFWIFTAIILTTTLIYRSKLGQVEDNKIKKLVSVFSAFIFFSAIFTPVYIIDLTYWRLMRNAIFPYIIMNISFRQNNLMYLFSKNEKIFINVLNGVLIILLLIYEIVPIFESSILPMFFQNWIIK